MPVCSHSRPQIPVVSWSRGRETRVGYKLSRVALGTRMMRWQKFGSRILVSVQGFKIGSVTKYNTYYKVSQGITKYHKASQGITKYHKAPQSITRHHKVSEGIKKYHKAPQSITRYHKVSQSMYEIFFRVNWRA